MPLLLLDIFKYSIYCIYAIFLIVLFFSCIPLLTVNIFFPISKIIPFAIHQHDHSTSPPCLFHNLFSQFIFGILFLIALNTSFSHFSELLLHLFHLFDRVVNSHVPTLTGHFKMLNLSICLHYVVRVFLHFYMLSWLSVDFMVNYSNIHRSL